MWTSRTSPEGRRTCAYPPSLAMSCAAVPAERTSWPPRPRFSSMLWIVVPSGMPFKGRALPGRMSAEGPHDARADLQAIGRQNVALLAVHVVEQRDPRGAVRIVLDRGDAGRDVHFVAA